MNKVKPRPYVPRNREFAVATVTTHAAAARPRPGRKVYKRATAGSRRKDW